MASALREAHASSSGVHLTDDPRVDGRGFGGAHEIVHCSAPGDGDEADAQIEDPPHLAQRNLSGADRKSTRLNSSHLVISYAVFCLKKKKNYEHLQRAVRHKAPA